MSRYPLLFTLLAVGAYAAPQKTDTPVAQEVSAKEAAAALARAETRLGTLKIVSEYKAYQTDEGFGSRLYNEFHATTWLRGYPNEKLRTELDPERIIASPLGPNPTYETNHTTVAFDGKVGTQVTRTSRGDQHAEVYPKRPRMADSAFRAGGWHFSSFGMTPSRSGLGPLSALVKRDDVVTKVVQRDKKPFLDVKLTPPRADAKSTYARWLLDPRHGYNPCLYQMIVNGSLREEKEITSFLPLGNGLWYPREARSVAYKRDGSERTRHEFKATTAEVLKDDAKVFDVEIPPGYVVVVLPAGRVTLRGTGSPTRPADALKLARERKKGGRDK